MNSLMSRKKTITKEKQIVVQRGKKKWRPGIIALVSCCGQDSTATTNHQPTASKYSKK